MYVQKILSTAIVISAIVGTAGSAIAVPDLKSFFSRPQFDLPLLLKDIKFGMSEAEVQRATTEFKENYYFNVKGNEDIQVAKDMSGGSLSAIYIDLASGFTETSSFLQQKWGMPKKNQAGQEYWKNDNIEYVDGKGHTKKGIFIFYQPESEGLNHSLIFKSSLDS